MHQSRVLWILHCVIVAKAAYLSFDKFVISSTRYASANGSTIDMKDGTVNINFTIEFYQDVIKEMHTFELEASAHANTTSYEVPVLKTKIDSCRVSQGVVTSFFMKTLMENFAKSSNYNYTCPFKKGVYKMRDLKITSKFLPLVPRKIFPNGRVAFHIRDELYGQLLNQKKFVRLYTWELFGNYFYSF